MRTLTKRLVAIGFALTMLMGCVSVANAENDNVEFSWKPVILDELYKDAELSSLVETRKAREEFVAATMLDIVLNCDPGNMTKIDVNNTMVQAMEKDEIYVALLEDLVCIFFFADEYLLLIGYAPGNVEAWGTLFPTVDVDGYTEAILEGVAPDGYEQVDSENVRSIAADMLE